MENLDIVEPTFLQKIIELPLTKKLLIGILVVSLFGTIGYSYLVSRSKKVDINLVSPPYSSPSPSPSPSPSIPPVSTCVSRVMTATIASPCSESGFLIVKYQCDNGSRFTIGDGKTRIDLSNAAGQASIQKCGVKCSLSSPIPSSSPTSTTFKTDMNQDGRVNQADYDKFIEIYRYDKTNSIIPSKADINLDGVVDNNDYTLFMSLYPIEKKRSS